MEAVKFKPMLASAWEAELEKLSYPIMASPKIDGIRAVVLGGRLLSRKLLPIPNGHVRDLLEKPELEGLDGELIVGDGFSSTTSGIMSREGRPAFTWCVFDWHGPGIGFRDRLAAVEQRVRRAGLSCVQLVPHVTLQTHEELAEYEAGCLAAGFEGVMLRDPAGPYKHGRSTAREGWLLKLKRFSDAEARIVGFEEQMHNGNEAQVDELGRTKRSSAKAGKVGVGRLGKFVVVGINGRWEGVEFRCSGRITDAERARWWAEREQLVGKVIKFKWQDHGSIDAPRSPIFLGFRDLSDL